MTTAATLPCPVIDVDSHWAEPPDTWTSRAPAKYRDRVPRLVRSDEGDDVWLVDGDCFFGKFGFSVVRKGGEKAFGEFTLPSYESSDPAASHPKERLAVLDRLGIEAQLMFETDYPHPACLYPDTQQSILHHLEPFDDEIRRKLLFENAMRVYRLPLRKEALASAQVSR